ncbi:carbohydrate esterase family 3 protein [Talaromyces proteolyticus]|uniref:Carbohydrate esterase family 3 protein n=1 Tax=Talaromyces proteolyticus TaxID=1131652 RepID=A0AAD4Q495_9EURO|nr:carbohydrate esterase family 3 protein [Talaromyces proteolyticus]KAH8705939.1 carbohydrate esterase family 3 protein [Talaromyces proteolyticus]
MLSHRAFPLYVRNGSPTLFHKRGLVSAVNSSHRWTRERKDDAPMRLMPLGGSVTYGCESSDGNGYRKWLYEMLVSDGFLVTMVGSRKAGSMRNNDNEGWRGFRIDQIQGKAKMSIPALAPDVVLINAGSNDSIQGFEIQHIGRRMDDMLEYVWRESPYSTIILSTLLVNLDAKTESRVLWANEQFRAVSKQKEVEQKRIVLVDMHNQYGPQLDDLSDGTHPNDLGYYKMAQIWYKGIQEANSKGFLQQPQGSI